MQELILPNHTTRLNGKITKLQLKDSMPSRDDNRSLSTERRWIPPSTVRRDALTPEGRNDFIFRRVRGILNKLTPENFAKLSSDLLKVDLNSDVILKGVILLVSDNNLFINNSQIPNNNYKKKISMTSMIYRSLTKPSMNPSTVLCTHSCASGWPTKHQTLRHKNPRAMVQNQKVHSEYCCSTSARPNLTIVRRRARRMMLKMSSLQRMRRNDNWLSGRCLETSNSSENWENSRSCRRAYCTFAYSNCFRKTGDGDPGGTWQRTSSASARLCVHAVVSLTRIRPVASWVSTSSAWPRWQRAANFPYVYVSCCATLLNCVATVGYRVRPPATKAQCR